MKKILNFFKQLFLSIPWYLRGLAIVFILFLLSILFNKYGNNDVNNNTVKNRTSLHINNNITGEVNANLKSVPPTPFLKKRTKENTKISNTEEELEYFFGSDNAPITIVEYSSYNCPHCLSLHNNIMSNIKVDYIDTNKVKYIKKVFIQKNSMLGVLLPYCAKPENRYNLVEDLYKNIDLWLDSRKQKENLEKIAIKNGFSEQEFKNCIKNADLANKIIKNQQQEARKLKIFSTPTLFINNQRITGSTSYNKIKKIIEEELARIN